MGLQNRNGQTTSTMTVISPLPSHSGTGGHPITIVSNRLDPTSPHLWDPRTPTKTPHPTKDATHPTNPHL